MKQTHLDTIISLQHALDRLTEAQERLHGIPDWMRELHDEHTARQAEITALEETVEAARLERRTAEGAIEDENQKLKRYQEQINAVQNQREYGALLQEIDTAKREVRTLEEQAFAAMERREQAEKEIEEKRRDFEDLNQRYQTELAKWESEKPAVEQEVREVEKVIAGLKVELSRPVLSHFERLRDRLGGSALAAIQTVSRAGRGQPFWHCSACNYRVRPQVVVEIRNTGAIQHCDACKRILYVPETQEVEA